MNVTEELRDIMDQKNPILNTISKLLDLRHNFVSDEWEVNNKWRGFYYEEPTWEPLDNLREDIPEMLEKLLETFSGSALAAKATAN